MFSRVGSFVHVHDTRVYSTMTLRNSVTDTQRIPAYNNTYIGIIPYHTYSTTQYSECMRDTCNKPLADNNRGSSKEAPIGARE